ncbi:MAG: hypothetical protein K6G00_11705 [Treponema sp.]|nr:hypothetical protein [Treponema sp.]
MHNSRYNPKSLFVKQHKRVTADYVLTVILICIIAFIAAGTVYALAVKKSSIGHQYRKADPTPKQVINSSLKTSSKVSAFNELGQIRTITKSPDNEHTGVLVIVNPWFSYNANDTILLEELSQKSQQEKAIIINYFGQNTKADLLAKGEDTVKEEIKNLLNEQMILGKIQQVYFSEYIFFE